MRGEDERTGALFSYVDLEARVRPDHPLRPIRILVNQALAALYPPGVGRSERQLMERLDTGLLFRWFAGLGMG
jgi:hypothetical protein